MDPPEVDAVAEDRERDPVTQRLSSGARRERSRAARDGGNETVRRVGFLHGGRGSRDRRNQGNDAPNAEARTGGWAEGASHSGRPRGAAPKGAAPVLRFSDQRGAGAGNEYPGRGPAPGMHPYDRQPPHVARGAGGAATPRPPMDAGEAPGGRGPGHRAGPLAGVVRPPDRWRVFVGRARRAEGAAGSRHGDATPRTGAPETVSRSANGRSDAARGTV